MQRRWVMAIILASGLLAQAPPPEPPPPPVPVQTPEPEAQPAEIKTEAPLAPKPDEPKVIEAVAPEAKPFDQLRPSQRKLAFTLHRAALSAHELGYFRSHPRAIEVRETLDAVLKARLDIPEKAQGALPAVEAYLGKLRANHGLYDADGKKLLLEGTWKELRAAAHAVAKTGPKGLEPRLLKLKGLLFDAKVDASAPTWAEPEVAASKGAKGKKTKAGKGPKAPEGFAEQKAITTLWVKRAQAWIENTPQEVEIKGEKKMRRMPDALQSKALNELVAWFGKDDLELLRDPGFGWLDLRRLGATPGSGLMAKAGDIAASKAPEGTPGELALLPALEPVMGESKFSKGEEKRTVLTEVKQGTPAANLAEQSASFEKLARSREIEVK
jgi:hypothetical protein